MKPKSFISSPITWSLLLLVVSFLIARLWVFMFFPIPVIRSDTGSYLDPAYQILTLQWPDFHVRPPGYPIFISFFIWLTNSLSAVSLAQSIIMFLSSIILILSFSKLNPWYSIPISLALSLFYFLQIGLLQEMMIYSDSLYSSFTILFFSSLIVALKRQKPFLIFLTSILAVATILIKPVAIYLTVVLILSCFFLYRNKSNFLNILLMIIPCFSVLLGLMSYNSFNSGSFSLTPVNGAVKLPPIVSFIKESKNYPDSINQEIRILNSRLNKNDLDIIEQSADPFILHGALDRCVKKGYNHIKGLFDIGNQKYYSAIFLDTIKREPDKYFKIIWSRFKLYFFLKANLDLNINLIAQFEYTKEFLQKNINGYHYPWCNHLYTPFSLFDFETNSFLPSPYRLYDNVNSIIHPYIRNHAWPTILVFVSLISLFSMFKTGFKHLENFIIFVALLSIWLAGIIVCALSEPLLRYSYPLEYIIFASPLFLFIILKNFISAESKEKFNRFYSSLHRKDHLLITFSCFLLIGLSFYLIFRGGLRDIEKYIHPNFEQRRILLGGSYQDFYTAGTKLSTLDHKSENALLAFHEALKRKKNDLPSLLSMASIYKNRSQFEKSNLMCDIALSTHPKDPNAYLFIASMLYEQGKKDHIIDLYRKARKNIPDFHPKHYGKLTQDQVLFWDNIFKSI